MIQFLTKTEVHDFIRAGKSHELVEVEVDECLTEDEQILMLLFAILDVERSTTLLENLTQETAIRILKSYLSEECFQNALHEKFVHYLKSDINQILTISDQDNTYCMIVKGAYSGKAINLQAERLEKVIAVLSRLQEPTVNHYLEKLSEASKGHALVCHIISKHLEPIKDWTMHSKIHMDEILKAVPNHYIPALLNGLNRVQRNRVMESMQPNMLKLFEDKCKMDINRNPQKITEAQLIVKEVVREMYQHGKIMY